MDSEPKHPSSPAIDGHEGPKPQPSSLFSYLRIINDRLEALAGFEARGIARVPANERLPPSRSLDLQVALLWFSANISLNNLAVGLLGPLTLGLGFLDCAMCAIFGTLLGSMCTAYMSVWGPVSGNRTMVVLRFFMGYWPSKIPCLLNILLIIGFCTVNCIIGGQVLSAVSGGHMTIAVGIVVVTLVAWVISIAGMTWFQRYERFAWIPQTIALFVLIGCAAPNFDTKTSSTVTGQSLTASRLTFFVLCLYVPQSWAAIASDFYVYYPERTPKLKTFLLTFFGLWFSFMFVYFIAIGLATGIANNPAWAAANDISAGALIVAGFAPLGAFGKFCSVIVASGVIANSVPATYAAALGCQTLGRYGQLVPRWVWSWLVVLIDLVLALAGREHLFLIFSNFLALMGYWLQFMITIVGLEHFFFWRNSPPDWERWQDPSYLPVGWAALASFVLGWVGAVLGMSQAWYIGPLASRVSDADLGMWIGCGFTLLSFPPLRLWEKKVFGR